MPVAGEPPWKGNDFVVILSVDRSPFGSAGLACKTFTRSVDGWKVEPYRLGRFFRYRVHVVNSVHDVHDLVEALTKVRTEFLVRGQLDFRARTIDGVRYEHTRRRPVVCMRRMHTPNRRGFFGPADHHWAQIDSDEVPVPGWFDPKRSAARRELVRYLRDKFLPEPFRGVTVVYSFSASAGMDGWRLIKLHLFFWLDRAVCDASLREYFDDHNARMKSIHGFEPVDRAMFNPVQPHYTAEPIFVGVEDPFGGDRTGVIQEADDEVAIPTHLVDLKQWQADNVRRRGVRSRSRVGASLRHDGTESLDGALDDRLQAIREARPGRRHDTVLRVAHFLGRAVAGGSVDENAARSGFWSAIADMNAASAGDSFPDWEAEELLESGLVSGSAYPLRNSAGARVLRRATPIPLEEARKLTRESIAKAARRRGGTTIRCDPNTGKTTATIDAAVEGAFERGERWLLLFATNDLADEKLAEIKAAAQDAGHHSTSRIRKLVVRSGHNCASYDEFELFARVARSGGRYCTICPRRAPCERNGYLAERRDDRGGEILVTTHAKYYLHMRAQQEVE